LSQVGLSLSDTWRRRRGGEKEEEEENDGEEEEAEADAHGKFEKGGEEGKQGSSIRCDLQAHLAGLAVVRHDGGGAAKRVRVVPRQPRSGGPVCRFAS